MAPVATEFEKIIHTARERKKNERLADRIFSANRPSQRGSLASRVGITKRRVPAGDVNGEWTHDLHAARSRGRSKRAARAGAARAPMSTDTDTDTAPATSGISIRGLAGPFAVLAQNFAPGTTAADVESAMTPVGGAMVRCAVVKTQPIMLVEMVFSSREGGERVIQTFHNKTADGRVIQVFAKPGGYRPEQSAARAHVVDGSNGFAEDLMPVEEDRLFYADKGGAGTKQRGRGFQRK